MRHEKLQAQIENGEETQRQHSLVLKDIQDEVHETSQQTQAGNASIAEFIKAFTVEGIGNLSTNIMTLMQNIFSTASATYKIILDIQNRLPSHLERRLYQEPFILQDAHQRIKPIYMDCINSWDAFDAWLEVQFRGVHGHTMVQDKRFVLHDSARNRDIQRDCPWDFAFLPGQNIVMCMLFIGDYSHSACPDCLHPSPDKASDIEW